MRLIIYGDFNCPFSYLASQRADTLARLGVAEVDWRAVEHDPGLSLTGTPSAPDRARWQRELARVASLALPGERVPADAPPVISNTLASVSAYAEAVTDGVQDELRRTLFEAVWEGHRHLSSAYEVRTVITSITDPRYELLPYLSSPHLPPPGFGDADPLHTTRMLGGTIASNGIPLTTTGWRRSRQWRQGWVSLAAQVVPTVVDAAGVVRAGEDGLVYLAGLLPAGRDAAAPAQDVPCGPGEGITNGTPARAGRPAVPVLATAA